MTKPMRTMLIALGIVFGGLFAFNLIKGFLIQRFFAHYEPPAVTVSSVIVKKQNWNPEISAVGNFEAINGVELNVETAGKITNIHFESGKFIQKDDLLLDLDDSVEQATLKFNQSDLALQELNYKRQTDLFKKGATPSSSVDEAHAKLLQAQANVDKTQALINQKHPKAPFSGRLGIRQVNIGQYITPGQTDITTLQSMDPLYLKFHLPEQYLNRLHIDQPITFSVDQSSNYKFEGHITAINSKVNTNTHNIELQAILANCPTKALSTPEKSPLVQIKKLPFSPVPIISCNSNLNKLNKITDYNFIPGMFAAIKIDEPSIPDIIVIPSTAISYSLYGDSVFVIEPDAKDKEILRVNRIFVKTGEQKGNYTFIESGLKPGQMIVSSGELKLQNGTRVVINNDIQLTDTPDLSKIGQ